jgi:hypothetical protein
LALLCVSIVALSIWVFPKSGKGPLVPSNAAESKISAGDIVIVNVFAEEMDGVYGYQFDLNYDREELVYSNRLYSDINGITTIFSADKERSLLVGAMMIGGMKGYCGKGVPVCRVEFTALSDCDPGQIMLSKVNIVKDDLQYFENVEGWSASITIR